MKVLSFSFTLESGKPSHYLVSSDSGARIRQRIALPQVDAEFLVMFSCNSHGFQSWRQYSFPKFVCLFILFIDVFILLVVSEHLLWAGQHSR